MAKQRSRGDGKEEVKPVANDERGAEDDDRDFFIKRFPAGRGHTRQPLGLSFETSKLFAQFPFFDVSNERAIREERAGKCAIEKQKWRRQFMSVNEYVCQNGLI